MAFDRGEKARVYAVNGVPEYWVVDVPARAVHQLWEPGPNGYAEERSIAWDKPVAAVTIAGLTVETEKI